MNIKRLSAIPKDQLSGKTVLVRVATEHNLRPPDWLPTLAYLEQAGADIIVASDEPLGDTQSLITRLIDREIRTIDNLADEAGEKTADEAFGAGLARLGDLYCNEAFALSHEVRASTLILPRKAPVAVAGLAFERDLDALESLTAEPLDSLLSILGGELSPKKLLLAEEIARRSDHLLVGGRLCLPFLLVKGVLRDPSVSDEMVTIADRMMTEAQADKRFISVPEDFIVMDRGKFDRLQRGEPFVRIPWQNVAEAKLRTDHVICDIGEVARWHWNDLLGHVRRIFWNAPLGISEIDAFGEGSLFLAGKLIERAATAPYRIVVCGQSLVSFLRDADRRIEHLRHLTTSGCAALHYIARLPLPAVDGLADADPRYARRRILIALTGSEDEDVPTLQAAAELVSRNAGVFLLHVRPGPDEERYPDFAASLTKEEKLQRQIESKRLLTRAKYVLAERGVFPSGEYIAQGNPSELVRRFAIRIRAELVVLSSRGRSIRYAAPATLVTRR
jgi:phosphoglycerate kinase